MANATSATDLLAALIAAPWMSDLVKVGIPSFITAVSIVVTARTTRAGQQKDLAIEALRQQADDDRVSKSNRSELVKDIAQRVVAFENAIGEHAGLYRMGYQPRTDNGALLVRHGEALQNLEKAVQQCIAARALVHLLADDELVGQLELYLTALFAYQVAARPEKDTTVSQFNDLHNAITARRAPLMRSLGKVYPGMRQNSNAHETP
ncbi:TPA: hypothetical protein ACK3Q6_001455 [Burkholderia cepacia]|nr:hypothetical protein [Burkholderia vietnamiensis]HDR8956295.1 hypothetical protein [Burkholderia vietnamiensis]HDV6367301.1 hypothetical protein [Burkholderia cepacia]